MINIILADDHPMFTEGVRNILEKDDEINILGEARDGKQLLELLGKNLHAHLVVLDIEMPNMNGIEVARIIQKEYPQVRILILSYHNESDYIYNFHQMGIHGYVLKNKGGASLVGAIMDIVKYNNRPFPPMNKWGPSSKPWIVENIDIQLTSREKDVLNLAEFKSKEIASQLGINEKTVNHHLKNMRRKFKVDNTSKLLRKAIKLGLIQA